MNNHEDKKDAWSPTSWKAFPIHQQPEYDDAEALQNALNKVRALPPIVHEKEIEKLKENLARACEGKMFLLQVGIFCLIHLDCSDQLKPDTFSH
jgi:3-deoxy-7-phosphoheptulonate synthase